MKNKKIVLCILLGVLAASLLGSCAIDKKCPAYTNAGMEHIGTAI